MIYLIDDKKERQIALGWSQQNLSMYKTILFPVWDIDELIRVKALLLQDKNIILFHESFFDVPKNKHEKSSIQIRREIYEYSKRHNCYVVFFSGSIGSRSITNQTAHVPVDIVYQNLQNLCDKCSKEECDFLKEIVFGTSNSREEIIHLKAEIWESLYDTKDTETLILNEIILNALEKLETLSNIPILKKDVSCLFLKFQLNKI